MHILLVDDEKDLVSALAERLSFRGFKTHWTTDATKATTLVKQNQYDLAVLDVKMPGISGLDLQKQLKKIRPELKFIFLSGHGSETDYIQGCEKGICYLVKPVKIETLIEKIHQACNQPID